MMKRKKTRSSELHQYGITLPYLAAVAGRSHGFVKRWSSGHETSPHLDKVAEQLVLIRQAERVALSA
jgi:hypothetical protein